MPKHDTTEAARQFAACLLAQGNRVLLSGFGGDEVTGGVPTPIPELGDLLAGARFNRLARQLKTWALSKRKPWFHLFLETVQGFLPPAAVGLRGRQPTSTDGSILPLSRGIDVRCEVMAAG